jgi:hypothetical protein
MHAELLPDSSNMAHVGHAAANTACLQFTLTVSLVVADGYARLNWHISSWQSSQSSKGKSCCKCMVRLHHILLRKQL